jgi:hypothetical protein
LKTIRDVPRRDVLRWAKREDYTIERNSLGEIIVLKMLESPGVTCLRTQIHIIMRNGWQMYGLKRLLLPGMTGPMRTGTIHHFIEWERVKDKLLVSLAECLCKVWQEQLMCRGRKWYIPSGTKLFRADGLPIPPCQ